MAAATVGRFVGTRARLVGAHVDSAKLYMETNGVHVQFRGFRVSPNQPGPGPKKASNGRGRHEATPTSVSGVG